MKILGYILVIFAAANFTSSFADETKLKLRKVKNNKRMDRLQQTYECGLLYTYF